MSSLDRFREGERQIKLHPAERVLLAVITLHLCFLPWAFGDMHVWSQVISAGLSLASLAIALAPRSYTGEFTGEGPEFRMTLWPKLVKFPIFWIGLVFLSYVLIQALNPAWQYLRIGSYSWLRALPHVTWLPHGIIAPFSVANAWRSLMIYGSAWTTTCALWVGFTRRRTLRVFLAVLAVNAFALASVGIAERALHADKILWLWHAPASYFVATFFYKNHASAYFDLLLSLCVALAATYQARSSRQLKKSSPSGLFAFFAVALALVIIFSYSRAATVLMLAYLLGSFLYLLASRMISRDRLGVSVPILAAFLILLGGVVALGLCLLPTQTAVNRMAGLMAAYHSMGGNSRILATRATIDLWHASPTYGWGAGSFRYAFPPFQQHYPAIYFPNGRARLYWEHAHNDYAETLAEVGLVGAGILLVGAVFFLAALIRRRFWATPLSALLLGGCLVTLIHNRYDFNFYNPAILTTWCALLAALLRWAEWEQTRLLRSRDLRAADLKVHGQLAGTKEEDQ